MWYEKLELYERILIKNVLAQRMDSLRATNRSETTAYELAYSAWEKIRDAEDVLVVKQEK